MKITYEILNKLYVEDNLKLTEMTKILNLSYHVLRKKLIANGFTIIMRKSEQPVTLTKIQEDILFGGLLGDACLIKNKCNSLLAYLSSIKEHTEFFSSFFTEFVPKRRVDIIKNNNIFDKRTQKNYNQYSFRSISNITFTNYRNMWYPDNKKRIPKNLILNPTICLIWYIGDGSIQQDYKYNRTSLLKISTNNFLPEDIEDIILPQLKGFEAYMRYNENKPVIIIPRRKIPEFLSYIGECPIQDYEYKWKVFDYKDPDYIGTARL